MNYYLGNSFSLNMVESFGNFQITQVTPEEVLKEISNFKSIFGHKDILTIAQKSLDDAKTSIGAYLSYNRESVTLDKDDVLFVFQYTGPRLPEGATELPEGATELPEGATELPEGAEGQWIRVAKPKQKTLSIGTGKTAEIAYVNVIHEFDHLDHSRLDISFTYFNGYYECIVVDKMG